jgi:hypothetical protein
MTLLGRRTRVPEDPRRLRELLDRACELAVDHRLGSVVVGIAGPEGDLLFPDLLSYLQSALRVEDAVFRLTRERAVLFLADVNRAQVETILARLRAEFADRFPTSQGPEVSLGFYELPAGSDPVTLKQVLPSLFEGASG